MPSRTALTPLQNAIALQDAIERVLDAKSVVACPAPVERGRLLSQGMWNKPLWNMNETLTPSRL